jgi:hypothetical protein
MLVVVLPTSLTLSPPPLQSRPRLRNFKVSVRQGVLGRIARPNLGRC